MNNPYALDTGMGTIIVSYHCDEGCCEDGVDEPMEALDALADSYDDEGVGDEDDATLWHRHLDISSPEAADRAIEIINAAPDDLELVADTVIRRYHTVTLRQIEAAGIPLDSKFGIDEAEHAEMLDDTTMFRVAMSPDVCRLEVLQMVIGGETEWVECVLAPRDPSIQREVNQTRRIRDQIASLVPN